MSSDFWHEDTAGDFYRKSHDLPGTRAGLRAYRRHLRRGVLFTTNAWTKTEAHAYIFFRAAPVAQGIEHQPPELGVAGSNPAGRTTGRLPAAGFFRMFVSDINSLIL